MAYNNPSITDFQNQFVRDFPYGIDITTSITNTDIGNAINQAVININPAIFPDQNSYTLGFLLLAAHFLVMNIRQSSQGVSGQFNFLQASKGAGTVNESFSIPQHILDNPSFSMYTKTNYGAQFLLQVLPYLSGQMFAVCGGTRAL